MSACDADPAGGKATAIAEEVMRIHRTTEARHYLDAFGEPSKRTGSLQIVFCDRSTPKGDQWNFYDELRDQLVAWGMPG